MVAVRMVCVEFAGLEIESGRCFAAGRMNALPGFGGALGLDSG